MAVWFSDRHNWDHCGLKDFTAMNLVPYLIKAHYVPEYDKLLAQKRKETGFEIKALADGQAILVKGEGE